MDKLLNLKINILGRGAKRLPPMKKKGKKPRVPSQRGSERKNSNRDNNNDP